nr:DUF2075 domain-containing protein [Legionella jordanis]
MTEVILKEKIFYWQGILGDKELLSTYEDTINKLLTGNYQAADLDLKKLSGHRVYSIRVNSSDRLLFTTITKDSNSYLLLLEVIKNHDYQKSRFLKSSVLSHYLETHAQALCEQIREEHFTTPDEQPTLSNFKESSLHYAAVEFYNQKLIEFNTVQQQALSVKKPLLISGAAGSGKSCLALSLLTRAVEEAPEKAEEAFIYVTQSDLLARNMKSLWEQSPSYQQLNGKKVQFKTYTQLMLDLDPKLKDKTLVDEAHCLSWLSENLKKNAKNSKQLKEFYAALSERREEVYQEFRIISGYSKEEYLSLGNRQSLFAERSQKEWLFNLYQFYLKHLQGNNQVHPEFYRFEQKELYSVVVVDESQDFSMLQLKQLHQLSRKSEICYCMDSHQSLKDNRSKRPHLLNFLRSVAFNLTHLVLPFSYRCPAKVVKTANAMLKIKFQLTGGLADKDEQQEISVSQENLDNQGEVHWFSNTEQLKDLKPLANGTNFAIVTSKEFKNEVMALFNTPLVFTPDEIKGLEYDNVLCFRLFDNPLCHEANAKLASNSAKGREQIHRAKQGSGEDKYGPYCNQVFTAFTRAIQRLFIYQPPNHGIQLLTSQLQQSIAQESASVSTLSNTTTTEEEESKQNEKWLLEARRLLLSGHEEQAKNIYLHKLGKNLSSFEQDKKSMLHTSSDSAQKAEPAKTELVSQSKNSTRARKSTDAVSEPKISSGEADKKQTVTRSEQKNPPTKEGTKNSQMAVSTQYVTNLFANFTEQNLINLFKNKNLEKLLFETPFYLNGPTLFKKILFSSVSGKVFQQFLLKNPDLAKKITAERLCKAVDGGVSELFWLVYLDKSDVFKTLLQINPQIAHSISQDALCRPCKLVHDTNSSPLFLLIARNELSNLMEFNPQLPQLITAEALYRVASNTKDVDDTTPFYWLTTTAINRTILKIIYLQNPGLAKEMRVKSLYQGGRRSAFYWLAATADGQGILRLLLELNPTLAEEMSATELCRPVISGEPDDNISPFCSLASTEEGRDILLHLLEKNPNLAREITVKDLCRTLTKKAGPSQIQSPIYLLALSNKGMAVLNKLFKINPSLVQEITLNDVLGFKPKEAMINGAYHTLYNMSSSDERCKVLYNLISQNPRIAQDLIAELLYAPLPGVEHTTLRNLCFYEHGRAVLRLLLALNPDLINTIPFVQWSRPISEYKHEPGVPAMYWLSTTDDGIDIFCTLIFGNEKIAQAITPEWFGRPVKFNNTNCPSMFYLLSLNEKRREILYTLLEQNLTIVKHLSTEALYESDLDKTRTLLFSPFYKLALQPDGLEFLKMIMEVNPNLVQGMTAEYLCKYSRQSEEKKIVPILYTMTFSSAGREILNRIFAENLAVAKGLTGEDLCRRFPSFLGVHNNLSPLFKMAMFPALLDNLLKHNPQLAGQISADALCAPLLEENDIQNSSAFYWLTTSVEGLSILEKLLSANPKLAMAIPVDALIRARTQKAGPYENCTALYHLLQTKQGRSVLKSIFSLNPQLAKDIPVSAWKLKVVNTDDAEKVSPVELLSPYWSEFKELLPSSVQKEVVAKRYGFFDSVVTAGVQRSPLEDLESSPMSLR